MKDLPLKANIASLGVTLKSETYYKLIIATDTRIAADIGGWQERNILFYTLTPNLEYFTLQGNVSDGAYIAGDKMVINQANLSSDILVGASNSINIKESIISGNFRAFVDPSIGDNYCNFLTSLKSSTNKNENQNFFLPNSGYNNTSNTVSSLSTAHCKCEEDKVKDKNDSQLSIFPNPAQTYVNIVVNSDVISLIEVFGVNGKLVESFVKPSITLKIDVSDYSSGVYLIRAILGNDIFQEHFIKE